MLSLALFDYTNIYGDVKSGLYRRPFQTENIFNKLASFRCVGKEIGPDVNSAINQWSPSHRDISMAGISIKPPTVTLSMSGAWFDYNVGGIVFINSVPILRIPIQIDNFVSQLGD